MVKNNQKTFQKKTLKMDENNQPGQAMMKPLPYWCIKRQEHLPNLVEFNKILDRISHEDKIGYLFIVDIKFHNINPKTLLFNEIYPPIFEKKSKKWSHIKGQPSSLWVLFKAMRIPIHLRKHSTLRKKTFIHLYAEDLHF